MYRLNPVRIRRGVIWARLFSFGCPHWMEALVEREEEEGGGEGEELRVCVSVCCTSQSLVVFSLIWMSQTACGTIILSLFLLLSKYTHTHDSCVWLGKCLWPTPPTPPYTHSPVWIPPTASFFRFLPLTPASYCYSLHPTYIMPSLWRSSSAPQESLTPFAILLGPVKVANMDQ